MVDKNHIPFWERKLIEAEKNCKEQIKFCEKHGIGDTAMKEKYRLQKISKKVKDVRAERLNQ